MKYSQKWSKKTNKSPKMDQKMGNLKLVHEQFDVCKFAHILSFQSHP